MSAKITVASLVADAVGQPSQVSTGTQGPRAIVSTVQAVAGVQAATATASLRYTLAASAIEFILLQSGAVLDTTGRYQYKADRFVALDGAQFELAKELSDFIEQTEATALANEKSLADDIYFEEVVSHVLTYIRRFADNIQLGDASRFLLSRPVSDEFNLVDQTSRVFAKATRDEPVLVDGIDAKDFAKELQDLQGVSDALFSFFAKSPGDLVTTTESSRFDFANRLSELFGTTDGQRFSLEKLASSAVGTTDTTSRALDKAASDALALADSATFGINKGLAISFGTSDLTLRQSEKVIGDAFGQSEALQFSVGRVIPDGVAMNDSADFADGLAFSSNKSFMNMAFVADARIATVSKAASDATSVADSGSLRSQGYCDFSYFAEDYVGDSRNF